MEQNIENKKNFTDKLNFFWRENKLKLLISLSAIFITLLFYIFWNINIDSEYNSSFHFLPIIINCSYSLFPNSSS